jgi:hypothetical protein
MTSALSTSIPLNIASGYSSGFSTSRLIEKDLKNEWSHDFSDWASLSWSSLKAAMKTNQLIAVLKTSPGSLKATSACAFAIWMGSYTFSVLYHNRFDNTRHCYGIQTYEEKANIICQITPKLLIITKIGLTALELYACFPKAIVAFTVLGVNQLHNHINFGPTADLFLKTYLPITAQITIILLGDPLTKVITSVELVSSIISRQS